MPADVTTVLGALKRRRFGSGESSIIGDVGFGGALAYWTRGSMGGCPTYSVYNLMRPDRGDTTWWTTCGLALCG